MPAQRGANRARRRDEILRLIGSAQRVNVAELTALLDVSEMTIRRDLAELEREGIVRRVHGGAVRVERSPFEIRTVRLREAKIRIGARAAALVDEGDTVAIDTGTTAHYVARALRDRSNLVVVTNSITVAAEFRHTAVKVLLVGGMMLPELSTVGPLATDVLSRLHVNKLILGCGGVTPERGLAYFDIDEVEIRRAMLAIADTVIVVADHSKFDHTETVALAPLDAAHVLVTDTEPPPVYRRLCDHHGIRLVVTDETVESPSGA